jgi:hypothetical protein
MEKGVKIHLGGMCTPSPKTCTGAYCWFCCILQDPEDPCYRTLDECLVGCPKTSPQGPAVITRASSPTMIQSYRFPRITHDVPMNNLDKTQCLCFMS